MLKGSASGPESIGKESRGPTFMADIWGRPPNPPLISIEYNEFGQPIGGERSKLCHFLVSIARNGKYCPLDVINWHAIPRGKKVEMLEVVKVITFKKSVDYLIYHARLSFYAFGLN